MDYESFYESLKYHLQKKGHGGQSLICRHTDIPRSYLSRIMRRGRRAGVKTQRKIARFFGFGLEEFVEIGRRITLGENPEEAVDLLQGLPEEHLLQRLTEAVRKEVVTSRLLDRTQLLYEDIVENSMQMIIRFNNRLMISFVNRASAAMTGLSRAKLMSMNLMDLFREECHADFAGRVAGLSSDGGVFSMEVQERFSDRWIYLTVSIFPEVVGDKDAGQLVGFDITERKKLEDKLRFIQHGVEMSYVPTLWIGNNGELIYVNKAVCELLGYTKKQLERMHVWDINPLIPRESWVDKWVWFESEENVLFKGQYRKKSGEIIPVEFQVSNLKYPDGRRYNVVFVKTLGT